MRQDYGSADRDDHYVSVDEKRRKWSTGPRVFSRRHWWRAKPVDELSWDVDQLSNQLRPVLLEKMPEHNSYLSLWPGKELDRPVAIIPAL